MTRLPLPLTDPSRTEFGFERACCNCPGCTTYCHYLPGYLVPADLARIAEHHQPGTEVLAWAMTHLLASPGAVVARNGQAFRVPTLVPARRADGACVFLTNEETCSIHAVAPYACAFFDDHLDGSKADARSLTGLRAVAQAWADESLYAQVWCALHAAGRIAPAPEEARQRMEQASRRARR